MTSHPINLSTPATSGIAGASVAPTRLAWALVLGAAVAAALITVSLGAPATSPADTWHGNVAASGWTATQR